MLNILYQELYILLYLNQILITAHLHGLRIVMKLIDLSFYKKLLELLTFNHVTLTLVLYSKNVLFWNSQKKLIQKTFYFSVNPSIIFSFSFQWLVFIFIWSTQLWNSWSFLGNKPSYKTNIYGKNSIVVSAINAWNNSQKLLNRYLSPNNIKKFCQIPLLQSIEMSCQLSDIFQIDNWWFFKIC